MVFGIDDVLVGGAIGSLLGLGKGAVDYSQKEKLHKQSVAEKRKAYEWKAWGGDPDKVKVTPEANFFGDVLAPGIGGGALGVTAAKDIGNLWKALKDAAPGLTGVAGPTFINTVDTNMVPGGASVLPAGINSGSVFDLKKTLAGADSPWIG